jgi:hypothetical protein
MKFLGINSIIKTNALLSRLHTFDPRRSLEIEAYSCKQTREQKRHKKIAKPLRFYISSLELTFPDYDFSDLSIDSFKEISYKALRNELSFVFFTMYKNNEDVEEFISYLGALFEQCVDIERANIYIIENNLLDDLDFYKIFMIHDKRKRRILIIKSILEKECK